MAVASCDQKDAHPDFSSESDAEVEGDGDAAGAGDGDGDDDGEGDEDGEGALSSDDSSPPQPPIEQPRIALRQLVVAPRHHRREVRSVAPLVNHLATLPVSMRLQQQQQHQHRNSTIINRILSGVGPKMSSGARSHNWKCSSRTQVNTLGSLQKVSMHHSPHKGEAYEPFH